MRELRLLLSLSFPIMLSQLGQMTLTVVDMVMVGRLGVIELDAAQLGHTYVWCTSVPVFGIVMGMDPLVSQAHGAGDGPKAGLALQRGLVISAVLSVLLVASWTVCGPALVLLGQAPELAEAASGYVRAQLLSAPFIPLYTALSVYLQARGLVRPPLVAVLLGNVLNVGLNYILIHGALGVSGLGLVGAGIATACTRVALLLFLVAIILRLRLYEGAWTRPGRETFRLAPLTHQLRLGAPIGVQYALEMWAFATGTVIAGLLDPISLAAHSIVLTLCSVSFMVPLGISFGASARVGNLIGARAPEQAQHAAWVALRLSAGVAVAAGTLFVLLRSLLPRVITDDVAVIARAASILPIAGAFQVFDGLQAVGGGILRGMGRPRPAAVFNFVAYFGFALPLGYWLAVVRGYGVSGIWMAYALGLMAVAACLIGWIFVRGPRHVRPIEHAR